MSSLLLDKFVPAGARFRPSTITELFALRLAQRLNEPRTVRHFLNLVDGYSAGQLLCAYRRTIRNRHADLGRGFHKELEQIRSNGPHDRRANLISIRVERRTVAAAIFFGEQLEYADSRQLSSDNDRAFTSAVGFVRWMLNRFQVESAALEAIADGEFQRRVLHDGISESLRNQGLPIWEIPRDVLFSGCGYPPLRSRVELREIATTIWPVLAGTHAKVFVQDAAILGLHVQIERQFIIN
jgi:hypothetical protein